MGMKHLLIALVFSLPASGVSGIGLVLSEPTSSQCLSDVAAFKTKVLAHLNALRGSTEVSQWEQSTHPEEVVDAYVTFITSTRYQDGHWEITEDPAVVSKTTQKHWEKEYIRIIQQMKHARNTQMDQRHTVSLSQSTRIDVQQTQERILFRLLVHGLHIRVYAITPMGCSSQAG